MKKKKHAPLPPDLRMPRASSAEMIEISRLSGKPHKAYADVFFKSAKLGWNWALKTLLDMPAGESGGTKITPDLCNEFGATAIMYAAAHGFFRTTELLIAEKADINRQDTLGSSPLMLASEKDHLPVVRLLLENGAKTDLKNSTGKTALHQAVENNAFMAVEALLEAKADPTIRNDDGKMPLERAEELGYERIADVLATPTAVRLEENRQREEAAAQQRLERNLAAIDRLTKRKPPGKS